MLLVTYPAVRVSTVRCLLIQSVNGIATGKQCFEDFFEEDCSGGRKGARALDLKGPDVEIKKRLTHRLPWPIADAYGILAWNAIDSHRQSRIRVAEKAPLARIGCCADRASRS